MSTNPVLIYADAKKRFDTARKNLMTMAHDINTLGGSLQVNWRGVIAPGVPLTGVTMNRSALSFSKANWPSGDQIVAAIVECHQAFLALENAYRAMPPADQSALCPDGAPRP